MKIIEEKYLKNSISKLNKFVKDHRDFLDFFDEANSMMNKPLQDLSFKSDLQFFDEVSFILSVIISIISHPHMINKGEEIIIRTELAPIVTTEMFQKTIKDPQLWSEDGIDMIPEYVYYYQQIDELRIYENIFVVNLIKKIEQELSKYNDFYVSMIQTINGTDVLSLKKDNSDIAIKRMNILIRKIKHIKNTFFYKEISKGSTKFPSVHPTNILLKDRLYNYCFKFYMKLITYSDTYSRLQDIRLYYFVQCIKVLKEMEFQLCMDDLVLFRFDDFGNLIIPHVRFISQEFNITLSADDKNIGLILGIENKNVKNKRARYSKHLLLFDSQSTFKDIEYKYKDNNLNSVEALSLWNMASIDESDIKLIYANPLSEYELMKNWIKSKMFTVIGNIDIYSEYCPVCKSQMLDTDDAGIITCEACRSKYTFYKKKENSNENLWFLKLRR